MTEQEVRAVVERLLSRLNAGELAMPAAQVPTPARIPEQTPEQDGVIEDIEQVDLRRQYLVENAHDAAAFLAMKERTPARIGVGRAGARYRTQTMLRFQADHAFAQASVFSDVPAEFLESLHLPVYQTTCESREEFLTRPDKGRVFDADTLRRIRESIAPDVRVVIYAADGLSSAAVTANAADILPVIRKGLEGAGHKGKRTVLRAIRTGGDDGSDRRRAARGSGMRAAGRASGAGDGREHERLYSLQAHRRDGGKPPHRARKHSPGRHARGGSGCAYRGSDSADAGEKAQRH